MEGSNKMEDNEINLILFLFFLGGNLMAQKSAASMDLTTSFLEAIFESAAWTKTKMLERISASPPTLSGPSSAERPV